MHSIVPGFNEDISRCLGELQGESYITNSEYGQAIHVLAQANQTSSDAATIGFEFEITETSVGETGFADNLRAAKKLIESLDFKHSDDEVYEISSPPSTHPVALQIAVRGLTRARLIPDAPSGLVTEHLNIGNIETGGYARETLLALVGIIRSAELLGSSSSQRLMQPFVDSRFPGERLGGSGWNTKGVGGVLWQLNPTATTKWTGHGNRIEYRSLQYKNTPVCEQGIDIVYYLTRALFDITHEAHTLYMQFAERLDRYQTQNKLPKSWSNGDYSDLYLSWDEITKQAFQEYMEPYANLADTHNQHLYSIVSNTVSEIRESYST